MTCNGALNTNCLSCASGLFLYGGSCIPACPTGMWGSWDGRCYPCDSSCLTCNGAWNNNCLTCPPGRILF